MTCRLALPEGRRGTDGQERASHRDAGRISCGAVLSARGYVVALTSRGAPRADLLVTYPHCKHAFTVQVKTGKPGSTYWLVGKDATETSSPSHIYVFVQGTPNAIELPSFFVVPSSEVAAKTCVERFKDQATTWYSFELKSAEEYRDNWGLFSGGEYSGSS